MTAATEVTKSDLRDQAKARVTAALKGELDPGVGELTCAELEDILGLELAREYETARYNAFSAMLSTREELEQLARRAARTLTDTIPYLHGEVASFNNLGILQSSGPAIDRLCGIFAVQVDAAFQSAYRLLLAVARQQASSVQS